MRYLKYTAIGAAIICVGTCSAAAIASASETETAERAPRTYAHVTRSSPRARERLAAVVEAVSRPAAAPRHVAAYVRPEWPAPGSVSPFAESSTPYVRRVPPLAPVTKALMIHLRFESMCEEDGFPLRLKHRDPDALQWAKKYGGATKALKAARSWLTQNGIEESR